MTRAATWKALTVGTALSGLSIFGAGAAMAAVTAPAQAGPVVSASVITDAPLMGADASGLRPDRSANASQIQTRGSTQIYTAPNPTLGQRNTSVYGPFFNQNRGLGGAAAIGGAAAGGR